MSSIAHEFHFFSTISSIPLVVSAINIGSTVYDNLKKYNAYVDTTLSATEQIVIYIANTPSVQKATQKLEKPLALVDTYACDGLQILEHKYPSIRMAPEELKKQAINQIIVLRGMGTKKLEQLMHDICRQRKHGMNKALLLLEALLSPRAEAYVDIIENTVDQYLPPLEDRIDEQIVSDEDPKRMFNRLAVIPSKVRQRLTERYNHLVFNITFNEN